MRFARPSRTFLIVISCSIGCSQSDPPVASVAQPLSCLTANTNQTQYSAITAQTGVFEASWTVTPGTSADAGVGFSPLAAPSGWTSMATSTRFYSGVIDVLDYDQYRADVVMNWTAGSTYTVRTIVDVGANTYSVYVTPPTGNEQAIATNYRFRQEQSGATKLVTSVVNAGMTGSITGCGPTLSSCVTATAGTILNTAFASQSGAFTATWDMTPLDSAIDAAVGLSPTTNAANWTDLATIVRFATAPSDVIDARNGSAYQAATTVPWAVNGNYRVRLDVDVTAQPAPHTYSIYVTSPGGAEQTLGQGYAFRDGQGSASQLQSWVVKATTGSARACNFQDAVTTSSYDSTVLADSPVAYWGMTAASGSEADLSGHGRTGTYVNGTPDTSTLPNGEAAALFNGTNQYLTVASNAALSIPTTHKMTWEAWIRPTVLDFPNSTGGYVDYMGKCDQYSPTCEWEARMYRHDQTRCSRLSAYAFNNQPLPGETELYGAGADWQQSTTAPHVCDQIVAGEWYHVVGEYSTMSWPAACQSTDQYPGSIDIWVNGVKWDQAIHGQTGCMSQYQITPTANTSTFRIGTMANDSWFEGAIGKVAIYNYELTQSQITAHYQAMTGLSPAGSCGDTCLF